MSKPPADRLRALGAEYDAIARSLPDPLDAPTMREAQTARQRAAHVRGMFSAAASAIETAAHRARKCAVIMERVVTRHAEIGTLEAAHTAAVTALAGETHPPTITHWEREVASLARLLAERRAQSAPLEALAIERRAEVAAAEHHATEALRAWAEVVAEHRSAA